jgi:hypothetical protein
MLDVLRDLVLERGMEPPQSAEKPLLGRTPACRMCTFVVQQVIESIIAAGATSCPSCGAAVVLHELKFDEQLPEDDADLQFEEDHDMQEGREVLAEHLLALMNPSRTELDWEKLLFDEGGIEVREYRPLEYSSTDEFMAVVQLIADGE